MAPPRCANRIAAYLIGGIDAPFRTVAATVRSVGTDCVCRVLLQQDSRAGDQYAAGDCGAAGQRVGDGGADGDVQRDGLGFTNTELPVAEE